MKSLNKPLSALFLAAMAVAAGPAASHPGVHYDQAPSYAPDPAYVPATSPAPVVHYGVHGTADWPGPVMAQAPSFKRHVVKVPHTIKQPVTRTIQRPVQSASTQVVYETVMVNGVPTTVARQIPGGYHMVPVTVTEEVEITHYTSVDALTYELPEGFKARFGKHIGGPITPTIPLYAANGQPVYGQLYVVKRGDTLSNIARRFYGTPKAVDQVFGVNHPNITSPHKIKAGQLIVVPSY